MIKYEIIYNKCIDENITFHLIRTYETDNNDTRRIDGIYCFENNNGNFQYNRYNYGYPNKNELETIKNYCVRYVPKHGWIDDSSEFFEDVKNEFFGIFTNSKMKYENN